MARPGTVIIGMHPAGTAPPPSWAASLPSLRDQFYFLGYDEVARWVTEPLARQGISDYRLWWIDVPEFLLTPRSLYDRLAGGKVPPWEVVAAEAQSAFADHQSDGALTLRHVRLVWTVRL